MIFIRHINNLIYTSDALNASIYAFYPYCSISTEYLSETMISVSVSVHHEYQRYAKEIALEFWNYFLDLSCQQKLENLNEPW